MYGNAMMELDSSVWNEINPSRCPCHGSGWMLSDYDTWHKCCAHHCGQPHPEYDCDEDSFDYEAASLNNLRAAYVYYRDLAGIDRWQFRALAQARAAAVRGDSQWPSPQEWVNAAQDVGEDIHRQRLEDRAVAAGYSCRLEAAMVAEGRVEAEARAVNMDPDDYAPYGSPERADADSWYIR